MNIFARLHRFEKTIRKKISKIFSNIIQEPIYDNNSSNLIDEIKHNQQDTEFDIIDAANRLSQSREISFSLLAENELDKHLVFMKPILMVGKEVIIEINVTVQTDRNEIIFMMPMYGDGSEGFVGDKLDLFYNYVLELNSLLSGGHFTKYPYDKSAALVFMHHLPLTRMDFDWFRNTLIYFVKIYSSHWLLLSAAVTRLGLKLEKNAALKDTSATMDSYSISPGSETFGKTLYNCQESIPIDEIPKNLSFAADTSSNCLSEKTVLNEEMDLRKS
jgi:hypothetical protein